MEEKEACLPIPGARIDVKQSRYKYSETGNMTLARNKNEDLLLTKSLDCYDKQRIKAARSIEFAQRSFKDSLKTLNSKLGDLQLDDAKLRHFYCQKRRQSSPAQLSLSSTSDSLHFEKGSSLQENEPLDSEARSCIRTGKDALHRHSFPINEYSSLSLKPDNANSSTNSGLKSLSYSSVTESLTRPLDRICKSQSVNSVSLPRIDTELRKRKTSKEIVELYRSQLPELSDVDNVLPSLSK